VPIAKRLFVRFNCHPMTRLILLVAVLCCALGVARAEGPDEQYVRIYQVMQEADRLNGIGQSRAAAAKYVEAQQGLMKFRTVFPGWNDRVINYRLNYVATKLAPLSSMIAAPSTTPTTAPSSATSFPTTTSPPANNVASTAPGTSSPPMSAEYENQLKSLQNEIERLQNETRVLAAKLKEALSVQPAGVDPREMAKANDTIRNLQKENELQKAQLAQRSAPPAIPPELTAKLKEQSELISNLRAENEVLKKQSGDWKQKYDALAAAPRPPAAAQPDPVQLATIQKLTSDNLGLRKEVELWKQVATRKTPPPAEKISVMPPEAQRELEALRARLQVFEAKPVPFTAEELALFYKPEPVLVANNNNVASATPGSAPLAVSPHGAETPARKVVVSRGVPAGAGPLLRAAEQAFATMHYAEAERQYLEVLHQDENNVTTLGNLASAQLELGSITDAEATTKRALALDPEDYFTLYVLGRIRFRQDRLDEALDALSRSAKANPNYADTQNYLGIVLSEKGQRGPAEAALRKAIQLQPDNAVAHNNLAVVYATQKPPAMALAKWHYQKAIASGHPKNAELERLMEQKQ